MASLAWSDPSFAQGRYRFQYKRPARKRGALILKAITPLRETRVWPRETNTVVRDDGSYGILRFSLRLATETTIVPFIEPVPLYQNI